MRFSSLSVGGLGRPLDSASRTMRISLLITAGNREHNRLCVHCQRKNRNVPAPGTPLRVTYLMYEHVWRCSTARRTVCHDPPAQLAQILGYPYALRAHCSPTRLCIYLSNAIYQLQKTSSTFSASEILKSMVKFVWLRSHSTIHTCEVLISHYKKIKIQNTLMDSTQTC